MSIVSIGIELPNIQETTMHHLDQMFGLKKALIMELKFN